MTWHLTIDRDHPRKPGEKVRNYFVGHLGVGNEVSSKVEKAAVFPTKKAAEDARRKFRCPHLKPTKAS